MKMKEKPKKENAERWLLTYADLMNLLLCFFIMLYAMSTVSETKYQELAQSLNQALGTGTGVSLINGNMNTGIFPDSSESVVDMNGSGGTNGSENGSGLVTAVPTDTPQATDTPQTTGTPEPTQSSQSNVDFPESLSTEKDMEAFQKYVNDILSDMELNSYIGTSMQQRGLTITFKNDVFFSSGKATLSEDMKDSLSKIARLINKIDNTIVVEGHTDNVPIKSNNEFDSNWQLSGTRATNVAQYLADKGYVDGSRMSAIGYAEFKPVASNSTAVGKSKNRRVDIVILYDVVE